MIGRQRPGLLKNLANKKAPGFPGAFRFDAAIDQKR